MVAHACSVSTGEVETGGFLGLFGPLAWPTWWILVLREKKGRRMVAKTWHLRFSSGFHVPLYTQSWTSTSTHALVPTQTHVYTHLECNYENPVMCLKFCNSYPFHENTTPSLERQPQDPAWLNSLPFFPHQHIFGFVTTHSPCLGIPGSLPLL